MVQSTPRPDEVFATVDLSSTRKFPKLRRADSGMFDLVSSRVSSCAPVIHFERFADVFVRDAPVHSPAFVFPDRGATRNGGRVERDRFTCADLPTVCGPGGAVDGIDRKVTGKRRIASLAIAPQLAGFAFKVGNDALKNSGPTSIAPQLAGFAFKVGLWRRELRERLRFASERQTDRDAGNDQGDDRDGGTTGCAGRNH